MVTGAFDDAAAAGGKRIIASSTPISLSPSSYTMS
jgi:hypothetical protein